MEENEIRSYESVHEKNQTLKFDSFSEKKSMITNKQASLEHLIVWNISKALEKNSEIDLKNAIKVTQSRLEQESRDVSFIISQHADEQYLACAMLAWQQLGHEDADSLYQFYEKNKSQHKCKIDDTTNKRKNCSPVIKLKHGLDKNGNSSKCNLSSSYDSFSAGPLIQLPIQTKIVMRLDKVQNARQAGRKQKTSDKKDIKDKIDAACCLETACVQRLAAVDTTTNELRTRATKLARREANRAELLERAEAAWKDLELGYQRRLSLAEEKEDDMSKQIQKLIDERNDFKKACLNLAQQLKERGELVEKEREALAKVERDVCERACAKLRLSEESARSDAILAENQIKAAQLDRDLQFKEDQARHKLLSIESEAASVRALTHETERALRAELGTLREQIAQVSVQLLEEETVNGQIKQEIESSVNDKMEMVEDLDGCKIMCDNRMQGRIDELQKKRVQLNELKDKVMECRCKLPNDVNIEAKRTPSVAALCKCTPEEKILESCSCTSLRTRLLSNLLADLFGGLQAELGRSVSDMPCQLLKCLEDRHNWDRASIVKTNLQNFFSKMLIGELDIAIATSIEKYHAKWVGASCADRAKLMIAEPGEIEDEGWQERVLEQKAQKLASQLAEQLFQERADELTQRARDIVTSGPPPCSCKQQAMFPCLVKPPRIRSTVNGDECPKDAGTSNHWRRTLRYITQLKMDMKDIKKDQETIKTSKRKEGSRYENGISNLGSNNVSGYIKNSSIESNIKKRKIDTKIYKKKPKSVNSSRLNTDMLRKSYNKMSQTFAVNLCLCGSQNNTEKVTLQRKFIPNETQNEDKIISWKQTSSKIIAPHISSIKQTKPILNTNNISTKIIDVNKSKSFNQSHCKQDCVCFHKIPSNTSLNQLLNILTKWKCDLRYSTENDNVEIDTNKPTDNTKNLNNVNSEEYKPEKYYANNRQNIEENKEIMCRKDEFHYNKASSRLINENQNDTIKSDNIKHEIPANTDSEYMGAINLDKSNQNCQCVKNITVITDVTKEDDVKFPYKYINTNDCACKQSITSKNSNITPPKVQTPFQMENKNDNLELQYHEQQNINSMLPQQKTFVTENIQNKTKERSTNEFENSINSECDYFINFLGVTLANVKSDNKIKSPVTDENCNSEQPVHIDICDLKNDNSQISSNFVPSSNVKELGHLNNIATSDVYNTHCSKTCQYEWKENTLTKEVKDNNTNDYEFVNVANLQDIIDIQESCVCCNFNKFEESNNLEENVFNLLQEYLKEKLTNFKKKSCKSSCIPHEKEEKLFSTIFQNVKEVISEYVKQVTCKCTEKEQIEESWNRAYGLLEEYLKIKVKRVQCLCITDESTAVPVKNILDRICNLIEQDFQRLKKICSCNVDYAYENFFQNTILCKEEIPVKDTDSFQDIKKLNNDPFTFQRNSNSCKIVELNPSRLINSLEGIVDSKNNVSGLNKVSKQNSNSSIILNQNISCQVPFYLGMLSKSCEGLETNTKNIQTIGSKLVNANNFCKLPVFNDNVNCSCGYAKQNNLFLDYGRRDIFVNHCLEKKQNLCSQINSVTKKTYSYPVLEEIRSTLVLEKCRNLNIETNKSRNINKITPYIGCTINCSCSERNLSSCVCLKSTGLRNYSEICDIWKTYADNVSCLQKMSYISKNIKLNEANQNESEKHDRAMNEITENVNILGIAKDIMRQETNLNVCDTITSAHCGEDLILKDSKENYEQMHNTTNTLDENITSETDYSNTKEPINWYECPEIRESAKSLLTDRYKRNTYYPLDMYKLFTREEKNIEKNTSFSSINQTYHDCDCDTVPICHVKMLVENIENNLINCGCTCDSLITDLCPIHSSKFS